MKRFLILIAAFVIYSCGNNNLVSTSYKEIGACDPGEIVCADQCTACANYSSLTFIGGLDPYEDDCLDIEVTYCCTAGSTTQSLSWNGNYPNVSATIYFSNSSLCHPSEGDSTAVYVTFKTTTGNCGSAACDEIDGCLDGMNIWWSTPLTNEFLNDLCFEYAPCEDAPAQVSILIGWFYNWSGYTNYCKFEFNDNWADCVDGLQTCCE